MVYKSANTRTLQRVLGLCIVAFFHASTLVVLAQDVEPQVLDQALTPLQASPSDPVTNATDSSTVVDVAQNLTPSPTVTPETTDENQTTTETTGPAVVARNIIPQTAETDTQQAAAEAVTAEQTVVNPTIPNIKQPAFAPAIAAPAIQRTSIISNPAIPTDPGFDAAAQELWVDAYNYFRSTALPFPAANMMGMGWNDDISMSSFLDASASCTSNVPLKLGTNTFKFAGNPAAPASEMIIAAIRAWVDPGLTIIQQVDRPPTNGALVGVGFANTYTQVIRAQAHQFGCARALCPNGQWSIVCQYDRCANEKWSNGCEYIPANNRASDPWYIFGRSGSQCPKGTINRNGLCTNKNAEVPKGSQVAEIFDDFHQSVLSITTQSSNGDNNENGDNDNDNPGRDSIDLNNNENENNNNQNEGGDDLNSSSKSGSNGNDNNQNDDFTNSNNQVGNDDQSNKNGSDGQNGNDSNSTDDDQNSTDNHDITTPGLETSGSDTSDHHSSTTDPSSDDNGTDGKKPTEPEPESSNEGSTSPDASTTAPTTNESTNAPVSPFENVFVRSSSNTSDKSQSDDNTTGEKHDENVNNSSTMSNKNVNSDEKPANADGSRNGDGNGGDTVSNTPNDGVKINPWTKDVNNGLTTQGTNQKSSGISGSTGLSAAGYVGVVVGGCVVIAIVVVAVVYKKNQRRQAEIFEHGRLSML